jgi:hypothetical protein
VVRNESEDWKLDRFVITQSAYLLEIQYLGISKKIVVIKELYPGGLRRKTFLRTKILNFSNSHSEVHFGQFQFDRIIVGLSDEILAEFFPMSRSTFYVVTFT